MASLRTKRVVLNLNLFPEPAAGAEPQCTAQGRAVAAWKRNITVHTDVTPFTSRTGTETQTAAPQAENTLPEALFC